LRPATGLRLDLAARYDDVRGGSSRFTARVGGSWQAGERGPTLFARWGEGYKLPSFYALGHPLIGNPELRPERSRNLEGGIEHRGRSGDFVRLTLFQNRFRDLVDFDPALFRLLNRGRVRAAGAEVEGRWSPRAGVQLSGALTWLDLDSPTPLRGRPRWQGAFGIAWQATAALELNATARFNGAFFDSSIPTALVRARGHEELDLGLRYRLSGALSVTAALRNLTDGRHEDAVGFPAPGRLARAAIVAEF
jgi:iron complex outermembrane receptor protein/vitamin B12 transporter